MKVFIVPFLAFILLCASCNNTSEKETASTVVNVKTLVKPFTDSIKMDTFKITLQGDKPKHMLLKFTVTCFKGKEIYQTLLKASDLLANYKETVDLEKEKNQRKFILEELNQFLDEENFLEPAITPEEKPDEYSPDKAFYEELKKTGLNGFKYRIGKETKIYIGWSAKENKVKIYYKCC